MRMVSGLFLLIFMATNVHAGIVLGGTRVIYPEEKKTVSLMVMNAKDSNIYLVQSWVDADKKSGEKSFIVTPPLFRINAGEENMLRIVRVADDLPQDRESVFWLNVKSIPAMKENHPTENTLQMVVKSRIKLFYRPKGLSGTAEESWRQLQVSCKNNELIIANPGAYYVSLYTLIVDGKEYHNIDMVPPKGNIRLSVKAAARVSWQAINDYGGITPIIHRQL